MRRAFTIVELVIVVLILGILASVAAHRLIGVSDKASDNGARQSLTIVRDAIDLYMAKNGRLPGADGAQTTFKSDLAPYIRQFPILPVGRAQAQDDQVVMDGSSGPIAGENAPNQGWRYYYTLGTFIMNLNKSTATDNSIKYDEL